MEQEMGDTGFQANGADGFQEMGKWGGVGWDAAPCSGWGYVKLGPKVINRI